MLNLFIDNIEIILWIAISVIFISILLFYSYKKEKSYKAYKQKIDDIDDKTILNKIYGKKNGKLKYPPKIEIKEDLDKMYEIYHNTQNQIIKYIGFILTLQGALTALYTLLLQYNLISAIIFTTIFLTIIISILMEIVSTKFNTISNSIIYITTIERYLNKNILEFSLTGMYKAVLNYVFFFKLILYLSVVFLICITIFVAEQYIKYISFFGFIEIYILLIVLAKSEIKRYDEFLSNTDSMLKILK